MTYKYFVFLATLAAFFLAGLGGNSALAANRNWTNGVANKLASDAQNWDGHLLPSSGDSLIFPAGEQMVWDLAGLVPSGLVSSADITLQQGLTVSGNLQLAGGDLHLNSQPLSVGSLSFAGGNLDQGSSPITISGDWTFGNGSASLLAGTATFTGASDKNIASGGQHFGNLVVNANGGTVNIKDDLAVDNTLGIFGGALNVGNRKLAVSGGVNLSGGALALNGGVLDLVGTNGRPLIVSGGIFSATAGSTVRYGAISGSVTVEPLVYANLDLVGSATYSLSDNTTAQGTVNIGSNSSLSLAGHTLNVPTGLLVNSGNIGEGKVHSPVLAMSVLDIGGANVSAVTNSSGKITVRVEDRNLNRKGSVAEVLPAVLEITTVGGDKDNFSLTETGPATGIFSTDGLIVHQGSPLGGNGQIEVGQNDIVFIKYVDPYDSSDTKTVKLNVALASGTASGAPQIISSPAVGKFSGSNDSNGTTYSAHITWATDQESSSSVSVSSAMLTASISAGSLDGVTAHDVVISGLKRGVVYTATVSSMTGNGKTVTGKPLNFTVIVSGDRVKTAASPAVYWYLNEKRNVFPDFTSYDSWFADFKGVTTVPSDQLGSIALGKNVPVRAGTYLVKIQSDPKVYVVEPLGRLRWLSTEAQAIALYGNAWQKRVRDIDVSQFTSYVMGDTLALGTAPDNYVFQLGNGGWSAVVANVVHDLSEFGKSSNGISARFVSKILPATVVGLESASPIVGYVPELNGVFADGGSKVNAPAITN